MDYFGFLTDKEIKAEGVDLLGEEFNPHQATGASYDMSLGDEVYISGEDSPKQLSETEPFVSLPRGQFALLLTREYVRIPKDYFALISIRMLFKQQGLVNISGFHVDPGFEGKIMFSVFNAGPSDVLLKYGDPIFVIFFYKLRHDVDEPYNREKKFQKHLKVDLVTSLKGKAASLTDVDRRVSRLETIGWVLLAFLIPLVATIIALQVT